MNIYRNVCRRKINFSRNEIQVEMDLCRSEEILTNNYLKNLEDYHENLMQIYS